LLPLTLASGKNTGKSREQISATIDRKRCIWIHCLRLPCIDTKFRAHRWLNEIFSWIVKSWRLKQIALPAWLSNAK
jgi:hypothetical protein